MHTRVAPEPVPKKPALQAQVAESAALVLLDGHGVQELACAALNEPAGHAVWERRQEEEEGQGMVRRDDYASKAGPRAQDPYWSRSFQRR